jgi:HSP20 family protein
MRRFAEEMDSLFEDFGFGIHWPRLVARRRHLLRPAAGATLTEWLPQIDVLERAGHFAVRADLPGMSKDDVKVEITDGMLTIQGERKLEKNEEREGYAYSECSYGRFCRSIPLPEGAEVSKATADFRNGVLEITMPAVLQVEKKPRRLDIR